MKFSSDEILQLLDIFWGIHDPTTKDWQGPDVGTQYRSVIFYATQRQKKAAEASLRRARERLKRPIVTVIEEAGEFYPAEEYHQRYLEKHGGTCGI